MLDEEQRRGKGDSSIGGDQTALTGRHRERKPGVCFRCGRPGHYQRDCCSSQKPSTCKSKQPLHQRSTKAPPKHHADKAEVNDSDSGAQMFVANAHVADIENHEWIIDSGASKHMTFNRDVLRYYQEFETPEPVGLGDGRTVSALGTGKVKFISYLPNN